MDYPDFKRSPYDETFVHTVASKEASHQIQMAKPRVEAQAQIFGYRLDPQMMQIFSMPTLKSRLVSVTHSSNPRPLLNQQKPSDRGNIKAGEGPVRSCQTQTSSDQEDPLGFESSASSQARHWARAPKGDGSQVHQAGNVEPMEATVSTEDMQIHV